MNGLCDKYLITPWMRTVYLFQQWTYILVHAIAAPQNFKRIFQLLLGLLSGIVCHFDYVSLMRLIQVDNEPRRHSR